MKFKIASFCNRFFRAYLIHLKRFVEQCSGLEQGATRFRSLIKEMVAMVGPGSGGRHQWASTGPVGGKGEVLPPG